MSPKIPRGNRRTPARTAAPIVVRRLTTNEVIARLKAEGFNLNRRAINHAATIGVLERPPRAGNHRRWTANHLEQLRHYCRKHSRSQPPEVAGEVLP